MTLVVGADSISSWFVQVPLRFGVVTMTRTGVFPWQTDGGVRDVEFERQVVATTNTHRASIGVAAVQQDSGGCLEYSAVGKSYDMSKFMYMQHDQPARGPYPATTVSDRFIESGYSANAAWGENISYGLQTAQDCLNAFLSDVAHRQNIENTSWRWMGVGAVRAANGLYFVTEDFGTEHDPSGVTPPPVGDFGTWMKVEYPLLIKSPSYRSWVSNNPGEALKFEQFLKNPTVLMPMSTAFGKFLVGTIQLFA